MNWDTIKAKMGYGSLKDEEEIDELSQAVTAKSKFDYAVSHVVTSLLMQLIVPWIDYCFAKYDEKYFHLKMGEGFDFIADWKANHMLRYHKIIRAIKAVRGRIILDREKILTVILKELNKRGWTITSWEKDRFRENISTLIAEIYS